MRLIAQFNASLVGIVFPDARAVENEQVGDKVEDKGTHADEDSNATPLPLTTQSPPEHHAPGDPVHD